MCGCVCLEVFADEGDIRAHSERFNQVLSLNPKTSSQER